ncbi:hypothetical protein HY546_03135, partial [archaeon]|nr:hypothetical protein [archaeon]
MIPLQTCAVFYSQLQQLLSANKTIYNLTALLAMSHEAFVIPSDLFAAATLEAYSRYNLGKDVSPAQKNLFSPERGGQQGDYRYRMQDKIAMVVDCLTRFPHSKRALIT